MAKFGWGQPADGMSAAIYDADGDLIVDDAELLDGIDSAAFVQLAGTQTITGDKAMSGELDLTSGSIKVASSSRSLLYQAAAGDLTALAAVADSVFYSNGNGSDPEMRAAVATSAGAGDATKFPILDGSGLLAVSFLPQATTTAVGAAELATTTEVNTGTDATRAITPDALSGSAPTLTGTNFTGVVDGALSANVPLKDGTNSFSGGNTFTSTLTANGAASVVALTPAAQASGAGLAGSAITATAGTGSAASGGTQGAAGGDFTTGAGAGGASDGTDLANDGGDWIATAGAGGAGSAAVVGQAGGSITATSGAGGAGGASSLAGLGGALTLTSGDGGADGGGGGRNAGNIALNGGTGATSAGGAAGSGGAISATSGSGGAADASNIGSPGGGMTLTAGTGGQGSAGQISGAGADFVIIAGAPGKNNGGGLGAVGTLIINDVTNNQPTTFTGTGLVTVGGNLDVKLTTGFAIQHRGTPTAARTLTYPDADVDLGDIAEQPHGVIYVTIGVTSQTTNASAGTFDVITGFNTAAGANGGGPATITEAKASNELTIPAGNAGRYKVWWDVSATGTGNAIIQMYAANDTVEIPGSRRLRKIGSGGDTGYFGCNGMEFEVDANETDITLYITSNGNSDTFTPQEMMLRVEKILGS